MKWFNKTLSLQILILLSFFTACTSQPGDKSASSKAVLGELSTPSGQEMVALSGGTFMMGRDGDGDESPKHKVAVSPFLIDKHEVVQEQYEKLMFANPAHFKGPQRPVEQVRWSDAAEYCNKRSEAEGLEPVYDSLTFESNFNANGYRLPTEAEWEYACRAGTDTDYDFGNDVRKLLNHAVFAENSRDMTQPVGSQKPNAWGIFDLYGNVSEWVHDCYAPNYYKSSPKENPTGPTTGDKRVLRGGSWTSSAENCRASVRMFDTPGITDACFAKDTYGFRCVRKLTESDRSNHSTKE